MLPFSHTSTGRSAAQVHRKNIVTILTFSTLAITRVKGGVEKQNTPSIFTNKATPILLNVMTSQSRL